MAIIYSYPTTTPALEDLLIGTDITGNSTQNFTVGSVVTAGISTHITGTANKVPLFTGANVIGDSIITQSSNKIGIGTTSPGSKLDIVDSSLASQFKLSNTTADTTTKYGAIVGRHYTNSEQPVTGMLITSSSSATGGLVSIGGGINSANAVNNIILYTAANNTTLTGTERMRVASNGNVGIGTTSPTAKLEVNGDIDSTSGDGYLINGMSWAYEASSLLSLGNWDGNDFETRIMDENSNEVLRVAGGKVGIGTTSPSAKLSVSGKATVTELEVAGASVAGSQLTSLAVKTSAGTEVNTWIDMTASPTSNATGDAYGAVIRAIGSGSNTDKGLVGINPVGRQSGTGGAEYAYGVLATGEQTGSGNIDFIAGVDARASSSGNGTATTDYVRGVNADAKVNNANATVDYLQGIHAAANLTTGTVGEVNVNLLDWDYTAGTVTGDLSYIRIQNDNYSGVAGTARAIHSLAALPSLFSGTVEVAGGDLEASTVAKGLVLKSPDGTRYRVTVANGGTLSVSAV